MLAFARVFISVIHLPGSKIPPESVVGPQPCWHQVQLSRRFESAHSRGPHGGSLGVRSLSSSAMNGVRGTWYGPRSNIDNMNIRVGAPGVCNCIPFKYGALRSYRTFYRRRVTDGPAHSARSEAHYRRRRRSAVPDESASSGQCSHRDLRASLSK